MSAIPRILVLGAGSIGERHLRVFGRTGRCEVAFCEPLAERRSEIAARYETASWPTWEEAFEEESFSAAVIASPAPFHIPTARALAERGIDLLIEKPLGLTLEGVDELVETVERQKIRAAVAFVYRALPALQGMRQAILSGRFGRPVQVQVQAGQHFPFYRPAYREIYYADASQGGGLLQDMLPHPLNAVEWLVGPAVRVVVDAAHQVLPGVTVEDTVHLLTRHGNGAEGVMASFSLNQHQPVNEFAITVNGERGSARWELQAQRWLSACENGGEWTEEESFVHERDDYYLLQANAFLDVLEGKAEPLCPLADGVHTLRSTLAVLQSRREGRWVDVRPDRTEAP
ncbi:MAG: Gfo/Idh/MocA family oxidoreductase [Verrucomicrobiales bacterium]